MRPDEASLSHLTVMAQCGDKLAYGVLLTECQRWLKPNLCRRIPPNDLDDLVQDVLLAVHQKLATYDPDRAFIPWLSAIAHYRWVDRLRRVYRAREVGLADEPAAHSEEAAITARISLKQLLAQLPNRQAQVIELVKLDGFSIAEAALTTGQSEALVKINIHRGLKRLSTIIEKV